MVFTKQSILDCTNNLKSELMAKCGVYASQDEYIAARKILSSINEQMPNMVMPEDAEVTEAVTSAVSMLRDYAEQARYCRIAKCHQASIDSLVAFENTKGAAKVDLNPIHDQYRRPQQRASVSVLEARINLCRSSGSRDAYKDLAHYFAFNNEEMDFSQYVHARQAAEEFFSSGAVQYAVDQHIITQDQHDYLKKRAEFCIKKNHFRLLAEKKKQELECAQNFYSVEATVEPEGEEFIPVRKRVAFHKSPSPAKAQPEENYAAKASKPGLFRRGFRAVCNVASNYARQRPEPSPSPASNGF